MEMLNYSLWFTLLWWIIVLISSLGNIENGTNLKKTFIPVIFIPAIAMLLEYLIVR